MTMMSMKSGKTIANKIKKIVKIYKNKPQHIWDYQAKDTVQVWLHNFLYENQITGFKDIKRILDAIIESPYVGYEHVGQVALNEPVVLEVLQKYQQGNVR